MSVEQNKKFVNEIKKELAMRWKIIRHIREMQFQMRFSKRKYYFIKQIEVAKRKLKN
jgi:hypothetical protein